MAKAKHTNVKRPHQDSAAKNTLNAPAGGSQAPAEMDDQARDPKRRTGQYGGKGDHHLQKY